MGKFPRSKRNASAGRRCQCHCPIATCMADGLIMHMYAVRSAVTDGEFGAAAISGRAGKVRSPPRDDGAIATATTPTTSINITLSVRPRPHPPTIPPTQPRRNIIRSNHGNVNNYHEYTQLQCILLYANARYSMYLQVDVSFTLYVASNHIPVISSLRIWFVLYGVCVRIVV